MSVAMDFIGLGQDRARQLEAYYRSPTGDSHWARYDRHRNLCLLAHGRGDGASVCEHGRLAARHGIEHLWARDGCERTQDYDPFELEHPLMLCVVFADAALRRRCADLPRRLWMEPHYPPLANLADGLDLLRREASGMEVAEADLRRIISESLRPASPSRPLLWVQPLLQGLRALRQRDAEGLATAVKALLTLHRVAALEGEWRDLPDGLIALWPLALLKLGAERGIGTAPESPYLPRYLLTDQPGGDSNSQSTEASGQ